MALMVQCWIKNYIHFNPLEHSISLYCYFETKKNRTEIYWWLIDISNGLRLRGNRNVRKFNLVLFITHGRLSEWWSMKHWSWKDDSFNWFFLWHRFIVEVQQKWQNQRHSGTILTVSIGLMKKMIWNTEWKPTNTNHYYQSKAKNDFCNIRPCIINVSKSIIIESMTKEEIWMPSNCLNNTYKSKEYNQMLRLCRAYNNRWNKNIQSNEKKRAAFSWFAHVF